MSLDLARSLEDAFPPAAEDILKEERRTLVWRHRQSGRATLVAKLYRHRGAWNALRGRLTRYRVEREHRTLTRLTDCGVPCTRSVGWWAGRKRGQGFVELLMMDEVPGAVDLRAWLRGGATPSVLASAFAVVRGMHDCGVVHQSLAARNLLVRQRSGEPPSCMIMDVATARALPHGVAGTRLAWMDLADLAYGLSRLGVDRSRLPLEAYGLSDRDAAAKHLARCLRHHPHGKLRRRARDLEARRLLLMALLGGQTPTTHSSSGPGTDAPKGKRPLHPPEETIR